MEKDNIGAVAVHFEEDVMPRIQLQRKASFVLKLPYRYYTASDDFRKQIDAVLSRAMETRWQRQAAEGGVQIRLNKMRSCLLLAAYDKLIAVLAITFRDNAISQPFFK